MVTCQRCHALLQRQFYYRSYRTMIICPTFFLSSVCAVQLDPACADNGRLPCFDSGGSRVQHSVVCSGVNAFAHPCSDPVWLFAGSCPVIAPHTAGSCASAPAPCGSCSLPYRHVHLHGYAQVSTHAVYFRCASVAGLDAWRRRCPGTRDPFIALDV